MRLLALDAAGGSSSVVIWQHGRAIAQAAAGGAHHSEQLVALVERSLAEADLALTQLDAIACGRGPGAFTGVRLALSVAQGLAFACGLRIIAVSNLLAAAERASRLEGAPSRLLVCQDARMQEVYWAAYQVEAGGARLLGAEAVAPPAAVTLPPAWHGAGAVWGVGSGFAAYPGPLGVLAERLSRQVDLEGGAEEIARIAARLGMASAVEPERAAPVYLREQVVQAPPALPGHRPG